MADGRIEAEIKKEKRRIIDILHNLPAPINHHPGTAAINNMFASAERRARITVLSKDWAHDEKRGSNGTE